MGKGDCSYNSIFTVELFSSTNFVENSRLWLKEMKSEKGKLEWNIIIMDGVLWAILIFNFFSYIYMYTISVLGTEGL